MPKHSTAVTKIDSELAPRVELTFEIIRKYINPRATEQEMFTFIQLCKHHNLDPFSREAYLIKYKEGDPAAFVVGFEVYLKRAERTGLLDGWKTWVEPDKDGKPFRAHVEIWRKDWSHPFTHSILFSEYCQYKNIYQGGQFVGKEPNKFWNEKPETMIRKTVAGQGFRLCFSGELANMPYTMDELPSTQGDADAPPQYMAPPQEITDAIPKKDYIKPDDNVVDAEVVIKQKPAPAQKKVPVQKEAEPTTAPPPPAQSPLSLEEMKEGVMMLLDVLETDHGMARSAVLLKLRKRLGLIYPNLPGEFSIPNDLNEKQAELVVKILMETVDKEKKAGV